MEVRLVELETWKVTYSPTVKRRHTSAHNAIMHVQKQEILEDTWKYIPYKSQINAYGATSLQSQDSISTNIYSPKAEKSHITIMSVGVHSVKHNIWKANSVFTLERNFISAQNAVSQVPNPLISNNTWLDIPQQLTSFGLRQHVVIVIYSATPRSTWTTLIFYDFIIIITWYL